MKTSAISLLLVIVISIFSSNQIVYAAQQNTTDILPNPITFRVVDKNNKPVINANLKMYDLNGTAVMRGDSKLTNADGEATIQNYPENDFYPCKVGKYNMAVSMYSDSESPIVEKVPFELNKSNSKMIVIIKIKGVSTHEKLLSSPNRVEFVVRDSKGEPVRNLRCNFDYNIVPAMDAGKYRSYSGYTDDNGKVAFVRSKNDRSNDVYFLTFSTGDSGIYRLNCVLPNGTTQVIENSLSIKNGYSGIVKAERDSKPLTTLKPDKVSTFNVRVELNDETLPEPIPFKNSTIIEAHSLDYTNHSYHKITNPAIITDIALRLSDYPTDTSTDKNTVGFLIVTEKGKYEYEFNPDESKALASDKPLIALAKECNEKYPGSAQWLAFMSDSNITKIKFSSKVNNTNSLATETQGNTANIAVDTTHKSEIQVISKLLKELDVEPASMKINPLIYDPSMTNPISEPLFSIVIDFKSGERYNISGEKDGFQISLADLSKIIPYKCSKEQIKALIDAMSSLDSAIVTK